MKNDKKDVRRGKNLLSNELISLISNILKKRKNSMNLKSVQNYSFFYEAYRTCGGGDA